MASRFSFLEQRIATKNPGIDFMYFNAGLCFRLGAGRGVARQ